MKKKPRIIISATAVVLCAAAFAVFYFAPVNLSNDELENALWRDALARAALTGAIAGVAALCNYNIFFVRGARMRCADYLWCLPCLAVALANFPYSALISGTAVIERADLLPAFILKCLFIATSEELLFRGVLLRLLDEIFSESSHKFLKCTIISSAVFALFHLLNLLDIADATPDDGTASMRLGSERRCQIAADERTLVDFVIHIHDQDIPVDQTIQNPLIRSAMPSLRSCYSA